MAVLKMSFLITTQPASAANVPIFKYLVCGAIKIKCNAVTEPCAIDVGGAPWWFMTARALVLGKVTQDQ